MKQQAIARMSAEIETIEDQNKRPKKTFVTPSTRGVGYAIYKTMLAHRGRRRELPARTCSCTDSW